DDDANASVGQLVGDIDDGRVEELRFINRDNRCFRLQTVEDRSGVGQRLTFDILAVVAGDKLDAITVVDIGLEDLNALSGDDGAAHAADQLFRLAAKHAAANHLDLAYMVNHGGDLNFSRAEKTDGANVTRSALYPRCVSALKCTKMKSPCRGGKGFQCCYVTGYSAAAGVGRL